MPRKRRRDDDRDVERYLHHLDVLARERDEEEEHKVRDARTAAHPVAYCDMDTFPLMMSCENAEDLLGNEGIAKVAWNVVLPPYNDRCLIEPVLTPIGTPAQEALPLVVAALAKQGEAGRR